MSKQKAMTAKELDHVEAALKSWMKPNLFWKYEELKNQFNSCRYRIGEDGPEYDEIWKELVSEAEVEMHKLEKTLAKLRKGLSAVIKQAKRAA